MSALHLITPTRERVTIDDLLGLLGPDKFNQIEATARIMRQTFHCPYTVRDYEEFKDVILSYYALYQKTFYNADIGTKNNEYWRHHAYEFAQHHLTKYNPGLQQHHARDLREQERNSITGRHGGMIRVIDTFTDAIINYHHEQHLHAVFFDLIAPSDYDTRLRLADEFLKKFGSALFPGQQLLPHYLVGLNLEEFITNYVRQLQTFRTGWEY